MALEDAKNQVDTAFTRAELRGLAYENAFAGAPSFLRRRYSKDLAGVDLAITGVPFDQAVTNRPGTRFGPRAIREAATLQAFDAPYGWGYDPLSEMSIVDYGDLAFDYAHTASFPDRVTTHIATILGAGVGVITLGGDHFITQPILRAMADRHGPVALIHFDAHSDTWADDDMSRIDHGTFLYKALKLGYVAPETTVSVGIRTDNPDTCGVHILDAPFVHQAGVEETVARIKAVVGERPCYISFDIDCLDPAFAPGTGTPVWGGLASWQAAALLRGLAGINMVGGDVVEVSPPYDPTGVTAIAGAHVATELVALYGYTRRKG
ncbi:agmatinase [Rhodobacter sp. JA431]|uniref:agmatinase n=1 Tax=Rhodobacter sp. JA431 TaxID=570013 RepID=UPI000BD2D023|nr:agmatinase [Rhodobacter sp. JA431]SOB98450.1 agmatinase [Rhodobacter sp. JA431]